MSTEDQSDYAGPPHNQPDTRGTLPPAAKTWTVILSGVERLGKELGLPVLVLLAAHWGIIDAKDAGIIFTGAIGTVLGGNFALRKGETKDDK